QVGDHGLGGVGGEGFAIGQPVTQIGLPVPLEERPTRIFSRPHAPFLPHTPTFPNLAFDVFYDFIVVDRHNRTLSLEFEIFNPPLAPCHSQLLLRLRAPYSPKSLREIADFTEPKPTPVGALPALFRRQATHQVR